MTTGAAGARSVERAQRRRALAVSTVLGVVCLALGIFQRHLPVAPMLVLGGALGLALIADRLGDAAAEVGLQVALVAVCVDIGWIAAFRAPRAPWTSPLIFLGPLPFFALLVGTRRTVRVTAGAGLATLGFCALRVEFLGVHVRPSLINFGLAIVGGAALALVQGTHAGRLQRGSMDLGASRARELAELRELDGVIFSDFLRPLVAIQASLAAPFDGGALRRQVDALVGALDRGRAAVERHHLGDAVPTAPTEAELRAPAFKGTLYIVCLILAVAFVRNLILGAGLRAMGGVLLVLMVALAQRVRRRGVTRLEIGAFYTFLLTVVLLAFLSWGSGNDNPTVCFLPAAVVVVHVTCGFAWVVPFIVPVLLLLAPWALRQGPAGAEGLTDLLLALAFTMATCFLYWRDLRARLVALELELVTTVSMLQQRLRLTASFFHDQANLLMALRYLAEQPRLDAQELAEVREMADRMRAHLDSVVRIYGNEARGTAAEVRPVAVKDVFDGLTLLYERRLREKGLTLSLSGRSDAVVVADPAVLLDSILSNLTSNAMKFTPRGGAVELSVDEEPGAFVLSILDGGPGFPSSVTRALARSERLPSTPGTEGEAGHGYGLLLAADLARRMGGKLTLGVKPGGGGRASVVLAKHAA